MAKQFESLNEKHQSFIAEQHLFFVGTAADGGTVNVSPKDMDSFRVIDSRTVAWLNLTGSGNETAAHLLDNDRMTIMFCSFDKHPLILRLYGRARVIYPSDAEWKEMISRFPDYTGARQVFVVALDRVQTSCGFAVPFYELVGERTTLEKWSDQQGREGIAQYWQDRNLISIDGKDTGMPDKVSSGEDSDR
ncbi:MAG: pyridoxamine 5'-phosphate oxidase family protein [Pseudomonadota bacterium]